MGVRCIRNKTFNNIFHGICCALLLVGIVVRVACVLLFQLRVHLWQLHISAAAQDVQNTRSVWRTSSYADFFPQNFSETKSRAQKFWRLPRKIRAHFSRRSAFSAQPYTCHTQKIRSRFQNTPALLRPFFLPPIAQAILLAFSFFLVYARCMFLFLFAPVHSVHSVPMQAHYSLHFTGTHRKLCASCENAAFCAPIFSYCVFACLFVYFSYGYTTIIEQHMERTCWRTGGAEL